MLASDGNGDPMKTALLVALVCLSTFAAYHWGVVREVAGQHLATSNSESMTARAKIDMRAIATALDLYRLNNLRYPTTEEGLKALVERPTDPAVFSAWHPGGYLRALPKDPWGRDYRYLYPGTRGVPYDLYTRGPSGDANKVIGDLGVN
jgi:general secretion pathway protein G